MGISPARPEREAASAEQARHGYIPFLDGIRAIAVLLVVAEHMRAGVWPHLAGELGVSLFFVLSGYLITSIALREESTYGRLSFKAFYIRRTFRIFPLYYLVLSVYCVLVFFFHRSADERTTFVHVLPYYITYFQEVPFFRGILAPFPQTWTLGIEEKFYLLWPVIAFGLLKGAKRWRIPVAILMAAACIPIGSLIEPYASILFGCVLALVLGRESIRTVFRFSRFGAYITLLLLLILHIAIAKDRFPHAKTAYALLFSVLLFFLLTSQTLITKFLALKPLVQIGKWSYSIYLIHRLCRVAIEGHIHEPNLIFLGTCALSCIAAAALSQTVEQPLIRRGRILASNQMRERAISVTSA